MSDHLLVTDPNAWRFLLVIPVIVLLYTISSRYRRRSISSTLLWRSVRQDIEARQSLRIPPLRLLMILQILAIAIGAAALAKPALPAENQSHLVIVADVSASMLATDVAPSRFAVAMDRARRAIDQAKPGDLVSLIEMGPSPVLLASSTERTELMAALGQMRPGAASADTDAALKLADSMLRKSGGRGELLLLSSGAFGPSFQPPDISVPVEFQPIGLNGDNQGITAADVRPNPDGSGRWTAFARVTNYADRAVEVTAVATADGLSLDTRTLKLASKGSSDLSFPLPPGSKSFALRLDGRDIFAADDRVELRVDAVQQRSVLLVSKNADPIARLLKAVPGLQIATTTPDKYAGSGGADLVVLDGFIPAALPATDLLILNPPGESTLFTAKPASADASVLRSVRDSQVLDSVDLQSLRLGQMVELETPSWAHSVVEGPQGPLILQGDREGRRILVFNFDWSLFDLPRMQAFPLLLSNAVSLLNPTQLPRSVKPGDTVQLRPEADATTATVDMPDGSRRELSLASGARDFDETTQVGRYTVKWSGPKLGEESTSFDVNLGSESQSDVAPKPHAFGSGGVARGSVGTVPGQQLWPILGLALLGVLSGEWLLFARRS